MKNKHLCAAGSWLADIRRGTRLIVLLAFCTATASAEVFVDIGAQASRVKARIALADGASSSTESGFHAGIGVSRMIGERNDIGVRLEADGLGSDLLLAVRALDYRHYISDRIAVSAFLGAARLDLATPAYGYYAGGGVQYRNLMHRWDLNLDFRYGDKLARDNLLPTDPQGGSPDNFYDVLGASLYLSYRF